MDQSSLHVPEGYEVVVVHPAPEPQLEMLRSGILLMDFARHGPWQELLARLNESLTGGDLPQTVVVLQAEMIAELQRSEAMGAFVTACDTAKQRGWNAVWVLPLTAASDTAVIGRLKNAGFSVHGSAEDGACFVEVHGPDGTCTIGMPGDML